MLNEDSGDYRISGLGQAGDIPVHPYQIRTSYLMSHITKHNAWQAFWILGEAHSIFRNTVLTC